MKNYKVVSTINRWFSDGDIQRIIEENDNKVKNEIIDGWEPIGSVSVCSISDSRFVVVSQTMILR